MDPKEVEHLTVAQVVERTAARHPEKAALILGERRVPYRELVGMADAVASGLADRGIGKGDRVAIALLNTPEMVASYLGCVKLGAIIVWANPAYRQDDLNFVLRNTEASTILLSRDVGGFDFLGMVRDLQGDLPNLKRLFVQGADVPSDLCLETLIERHQGATSPHADIDVRNDVLFLQHTSGTTGVPKAAAHTNHHMVRNAVDVLNSYNGTDDDVYIGHLPFFHLYGRTCTLNPSLFSGGTCIIQLEFQPAESLRLMAEHGVTVQHCAPTHLILQMDVADFASYDLSALRTGYVGGFVCPVDAFKRACDGMGCHYLGAWGSSEAFLGFASQWDDSLELRSTTVGKPLPGYEFKIIDADGNTLPPGKDGELCVRSYSVLREYWNNPEETAKQLEPDGWLHTGDMAVSDDGQRVRIVGRFKELVNRGGMKIYPSELEIILDTHPKVKEVCVISTPNPVLGESICACVVSKGGEIPTLAEIRDFLSSHVAKYKLPDELSIFDEFPRLSGGVKLRKFGAGGIQEMAIKDERRESVR